MGKHSSIEWTHHTFNPWWGCTKVSPGCKHCYAETFSRRVGADIWGPKRERRFFSDAHWQEPLKWNIAASRAGSRARVFCSSMADVFEDRRELDDPRARLWDLVDRTPNLDWLLLTKRPDNIACAVPWGDRWPANVWLGTTAENQRWAEKRIPILLQFPAVVRFVSCEPLLGPLTLEPWLRGRRRIDWVIAGGESGHKARPMNPDWVRSLREQCQHAAVHFHFKQWGHWAPDDGSERPTLRRVHLRNGDAPVSLVRVGKHAAGRVLDGRTWDEYPHPNRLRLGCARPCLKKNH
jgi:protein gp37